MENIILLCYYETLAKLPGCGSSAFSICFPESVYRRRARRWRKLYRVNGHLFQAKSFNRVSLSPFSDIHTRFALSCRQLVEKKWTKIESVIFDWIQQYLKFEAWYTLIFLGCAVCFPHGETTEFDVNSNLQIKPLIFVPILPCACLYWYNVQTYRQS